ncbi:MAG: hypothetical protein AB8B72_04705 [Crocinitomicaceae bacterium]
MRYLFFFFFTAILLVSCNKNKPKKVIDNRQFKMGFSTWPFGTTESNVTETYNFLEANGDVYSEHIDDKIPWQNWIGGSELPQEFVDGINYKLSKKPTNLPLLLSISFLNNGRSDIMEDRDGSIPNYVNLNDSAIQAAYFNHVCYMVDAFKPTYLLYAIESNELLNNTPEKWESFRALMDSIQFKLKEKYPNIEMAESVTLHNWYEPNVIDKENYVTEIDQVASNGDFTAISFYPFFKGLNSKNDFQKAFDFLHSKTSLPVAFVETNHIAEDLVVDGLNLNIESNEKEQNEYLEALLINAHTKNYKFIIWWAHRDYDALWETFPNEVKDLGKIWRDTGLQDEDGNDRASLKTWRQILAK